jgi:hypothetical protein
MNTTRKGFLVLPTLLCFVSFLLPPGRVDAEAQQNPALKRFYSELKTLFLRHYPQVTSHLLGEKIHFEQDTRVFILHEPLKTGEWQDPREVRGPKLGGILCDIELRDGKFAGAAAVPQTFDKRYFQLSVMEPYSARRNAHLYVHLSHPNHVSGDFLKQFTELVNSFEKYVD